MRHLALKAASTLVHSHVEGGWWFASLLVAVEGAEVQNWPLGKGIGPAARGARDRRASGPEQLIEAVDILPRHPSSSLDGEAGKDHSQRVPGRPRMSFLR